MSEVGFDKSNFCREEIDFLCSVRQFVRETVLPNTRQWEFEKRFPLEIWSQLGELGLLSMTLSKKWGGREYSCLTYTTACIELAKGDPALAMNLAAINALCIPHIEHFGTEEQKNFYFKGICEGKIKLAWALTEPEAGSDARCVRSSAAPIENRPGYYHINGEKMFITNGGHCDLFILIARTSEKELSAFLVEKDQPGLKDFKRIHTVGVQASNTVSFSLENAVGWHTPCTFEQAISFLLRGRLGIAGMAVGIAEKSLELTTKYAKQRIQFNRRLADMQSVQNMLADSAMELEASRLMLEKGSKMYDRGEDIIMISSMAKLYASEMANRVTNRSIQIHGGRGMTQEYLVEKLWRDAKLTEIGEGCSEIQRLIISKNLLKKESSNT